MLKIHEFVANQESMLKLGIENRKIILEFCDFIINEGVEAGKGDDLTQVNLTESRFYSDDEEVTTIVTTRHLLWIPNTKNIIRAGRFDEHDHARWTFTLWFVDINTHKIIGKQGENFGYHKFSVNKETLEISYLHSTTEI